MAVIQVNTREFRDRQASLLELADRGENIVIRRGRKTAYTLTPVTDDDLYFTPEMMAKIDMSLKQVQEGEVKRFDCIEDLDTYIKQS